MNNSFEAWKMRNLYLAMETFEILGARDHEIIQLSKYHFRINRRLDVWPSTKKWYDTKSHMKGEYGDLFSFVMLWFEEHEKGD